MDQNCSSLGYVDGKIVGGVAPLVFVTGFVCGFVVLVFVPSLYRRLRYVKRHFCALCCYFTQCSQRSDSTVSTSKPKQPAARYYTEIDEESIPRSYPVRNNTQTNLKYEDVVTMRDEHRYSDVETKSESYVNVGISNPAQKPETTTPDAQPIYYILEPDTYKRLPVKLYSDSVDYYESNVYFVLEPGSNNVKPTFEKPQRNTTNTYFILEPNNSTCETFDAEAYAVSDLDSSHAYFILEKQF